MFNWVLNATLKWILFAFSHFFQLLITNFFKLCCCFAVMIFLHEHPLGHRTQMERKTKTFRKHTARLLNNLCIFNLCPVSRRKQLFCKCSRNFFSRNYEKLSGKCPWQSKFSGSIIQSQMYPRVITGAEN